MDLRPHVDNLRHELMVAAEAGGADARALAERLVAPLESATRLTLLNALSTAADEITRDLAPGSVEIRLRGVDPSFVVTPPPVDQWFEDAMESGFDAALTDLTSAEAAGPPSHDEGATARINFRPPEHLKARIDEAAAREGISVNAWLVRAVTATLNPDGHRAERRAPRGGQSYTGWVR